MGDKSERNSTVLTAVDTLQAVFIESQVEQDAEKQNIQ